MWYQIFKFELAYRKKRAATYIYFMIFFLLAFLAISTDIVTIGGGVGQIKENSPSTIANMMLIMSVVITLVASAIMGVPVLRDFEHKTDSLMFSTPIRKRDYLLGRFLGSYVVLLFVSFGLVLGFVLGEFMPWRDTENLLPFSLINYLHPYFLFVVPNLFVMGVLFFATGSLSRKMLVVYTQGMIFLVLYMIANQLSSDLENLKLGALLDPFGGNAYNLETRYWSITEKNNSLVPVSGIILWNRILWVGISLLGFILLLKTFNFNVVRNSIIKRKAKKEKRVSINERINIPEVSLNYSFLSQIQRVWRLSIFYCKSMFREYAFIGIVICGVVMLIVNATQMGKMYGTPILPTTYSMIGMISSFTLFFFILTVFYTGELVWKERSTKLDQIHDSMPIPEFSNLLGKFFGLVFAYAILTLFLILFGIVTQALYGYFNFEIGLYFKTLFTDNFSMIILYTLLAFFIQVMVNNKFVGYMVVVVVFLLVDIMSLWGLEHSLWQFAENGLGRYSDMNKFGHYVNPFNWRNLYWFGFAGILFTAAVTFSIRGTETHFRKRWQLSKLRWNRNVTMFSVACIVVFLATGSYIFYSTRVINEFTSSDEREEWSADYEKQLKQFEFIAQPKIVDVNLKVDIYPENRDYVVEGYYYLKNKTKEAINAIHIQHNPGHEFKTVYLEFDRASSVNPEYSRFEYSIYTFNEALQPGDSVRMNFKQSFTTEAFVDRGSNTSIVQNGTFFNNTYFPTIGYNDGYELGSKDKRKDHELKEKERMMERTDSRGTAMNLFGDDADRIQFEMVMSTSEDQIAIAPGYLQKQWKENGRNYFHYKMDQPMVNFYSMVSARYEIKRDKWNDVNLEIYYHKGHEYNLDRMMEAMKNSLDYYTENFSDFQYKQLRIMEFPRYSSFAQSFANTIPFSEGIGFIANIDKEEDLDMPFYVTAHEIGHQWWGHQVTEASVKGNGMLSEALTQYSCLMVMKHAYSQEYMQKFLKYELDKYLSGRSGERRKEMPIAECEAQGYIHYNKGSLLMYTLQDYISEDSVNAALRSYLKDWAYSEDRYPTTLDLLPYFREVTPDSLSYLIDDMFEKITLYENKTADTKYELTADNKYKVTIDVQAKKFYADTIGRESIANLNDWIDIGVYTKDQTGEEKLAYLKKHKLNREQNSFEILIDTKPTRAGIDPLNKLIDKHPSDNVKKVEVNTI